MIIQSATRDVRTNQEESAKRGFFRAGFASRHLVTARSCQQRLYPSPSFARYLPNSSSNIHFSGIQASGEFPRISLQNEVELARRRASVRTQGEVTCSGQYGGRICAIDPFAFPPAFGVKDSALLVFSRIIAPVQHPRHVHHTRPCFRRTSASHCSRQSAPSSPCEARGSFLSFCPALSASAASLLRSRNPRPRLFGCSHRDSSAASRS
jgi:hypothetical protein